MLADVIVVVSTAQGKSDKLFVERFFIVCMNTFSFTLQQLVQNGQLTAQTYVWKPGMVNWEFAANIQELTGLFNSGIVPPPIPAMP